MGEMPKPEDCAVHQDFGVHALMMWCRLSFILVLLKRRYGQEQQRAVPPNERALKNKKVGRNTPPGIMYCVCASEEHRRRLNTNKQTKKREYGGWTINHLVMHESMKLSKSRREANSIESYFYGLGTAWLFF